MMERGAKKERSSVPVTMAPGSAYVLMGAAQGRCPSHITCNCCWTHGIRLNQESVVAQQSMTFRVLAAEDTASDGEGSSGDSGGS